ncbi:MAG: hypothetical protein FJY20_03900 [Bacteroidetes bacterium]|nr:hypothetical protein [Bacteroidota bacterium]
MNITHTGSSIVVKYLNPGDCPTGHNCVLGGGGAYYLKGTVGPNNKMELTMLRCTHKKAMRDDGLSDRWTSPCKVSSVTETSIKGTARIEWYMHEIRDGKEVNFTREPSMDYDEPFGLTRTDCKKELERLAAEVDRKAESFKDQVSACDDVSKSSTEAVDRLGEELDAQIEEGFLNTVVPPPARVGTFNYSDDPAGAIESWADLVKDLAQSTGKIAAETGVWIVLTADMLIDLGNLNAKGIVVIQETGQINEELNKMRERRFEAYQSWLYAILEYNKLSELCTAEIPKEQQPKPVNSTVISDQRDEMKRMDEEAGSIHSGLRADIGSAESTIAASNASVNKLGQFLERIKMQIRTNRSAR